MKVALKQTHEAMVKATYEEMMKVEEKAAVKVILNQNSSRSYRVLIAPVNGLKHVQITRKT